MGTGEAVGGHVNVRIRVLDDDNAQVVLEGEDAPVGAFEYEAVQIVFKFARAHFAEMLDEQKAFICKKHMITEQDFYRNFVPEYAKSFFSLFGDK